jgi:glycosyltransferase involved in cell wall biosynthesis
VRVLYVCLDRGIEVGGTKGAAIHVAEMTGALRAEGHEVSVLARRGVAGADVTIAAVPSQHVAGPMGVLRRDVREVRISRALRREVAAAISRFRPELIYERYALFRSEGVAVSARAGIPHVLEVNAPLVDEEVRFRGLALARIARQREAMAWTGTGVVVVPSHPLAAIVRAVGARRVEVVPNAVDPERFRPRGQASAVRSRYGLGDAFVVGFTGSLKGWHDLPVVVDAVAALARSTDRAVVVFVVGDGPERDALEARAATAGVRLVMTGALPHDDVPALTEAMDVCVTPLTPDPTLHYFSPLKALEYLAMERPVVVAMAGDLDAFVRDDLALGYRPGDAADLAARLGDVLRDPGAAAARAARGAAYAREHTWRAAARKIVSSAMG